MTRLLMKPLTLEDGNTLRCAHAKVWPPPHLHLIPKVLGLDTEYLRNRIPNEIYLRVKTWEGVCGLTAMNADKCPSCPHVLRGEEQPRPRQSVLVPPPATRASPVARARAATPSTTTETVSRRPSVPQSNRVREYLDMDARKARLDQGSPEHAALLQRMAEVLRALTPAEHRQLGATLRVKRT